MKDLSESESKYLYTFVEEIIVSDEFGEYNTFGIKIFKIEDLGNREVCCVRDVSTNKEFVCRLVEDCNKYELDPIHIFDVIEDRL